MEIREVREEEQEEAFFLGSQAFMQGSRDMSWVNHPDRLQQATFGVWDAQGLQAMVSIVAFRIHLGSRVVVPMGGVAGVACLPASRGKGYAGTCLRYSLERMREAGQVVSALFPFSFDYYQRFGWEWVGMTRNYKLSPRILRSDPETENVRAATDADRPAIAAAYEAFAQRYRGMVVREDKNWNRALNHSDQQYRYTYLYEVDDGVEGYLTYAGGKKEETRLREFVTLTPRARRAMLGLLRRHEMQIDRFKWDAPSDDLLWSTLYHWDLETKIEPATMGRVVDVPAAIRAWRPSAEASGMVCFAVQDESAPWNQGTWKVEFAAGEATVAPTDAAPQLSLDIQALSQAYFGTPTVPEIREAGRITVHDEPGYRAFRDLFAGPPMWINDHF